MPEIKNPSDSHALEPLLNGVIPALDAAIAHGVTDPDRIAVLGGFALKVRTSAEGAEYDSQGEARSEAERVAPG